MARPMMDGLLYFPFDTDFFQDTKIRMLRTRHGTDGIAVYLYLLCLIYKNGYYVVYDEDLLLIMSGDLNISEDSTRLIISFLISRSLLYEIKDSTLAVSDTVLTAKSIQERYQEAKKGSKRDIFVDADYWLLPEEKTLGFIKVCNIGDKSGKNCDKSGKNCDKSGKNSTKKRKGKESKINKNKEIYAPTEEKKTVRHKYGEYENVLLSDNDLEKLKSEYPNDYEKRIERLSEYIASTGKSYKNHLATIRSWARRDKPENQKTHSIYCVDENEDTLDDLF